MKHCPQSRSLLLALLFALLATNAVAQTDVSPFTVVVIRPHTRLSDWRSDPTSAQVMLHNNTAGTLRLRLSGHIDNPSAGVTVTTKDDEPRVPAIVLAPGETRTLYGNSREFSILNPDAVRISGTDATTIERTGALPEGGYTMCLRAVDYDAPHTPRSTEMCPSFTLRYVDPPTLIQPTCETRILATTPLAVIFSWTQPMPPVAGGIVNYDFVMCEVPPSSSPEEAFRTRTSPDFFHHLFVNQTSFTYSPTEPALVAGRTYAWRVQAIDPSGGTFIRNNGASPICSFTYGTASTAPTGGGSASCSNPTITAAYPPSGERVPYRYVPVIIRFDPYCDEYTHFHSEFTPAGGATETRELNWLGGPLAAQRAALGTPISQEQSQYIWIGRHAGAPYPPGTRQNWNGTVALTVSGVPIPRSVSGYFLTGMGPSQLSQPANDATVSAGDVTFRWQTANAPSIDAIKPRYDIQQSTSTGGTTVSGLSIHEKWVLEVSRSRDMSSPVWTTNGIIGDGVDANTLDASAISAAIYRSLDAHNPFTDTGNYYWRVKWLTSDDLTSSPYATSDVWHFRIGAGAGGGSSSSISGDSCLRITPVSPEIAGTWTASPRPRFSVRVEPEINIASVTGGRLQVWERSGTEDDATTMAHSTVLDRTFDGHEDANLHPRAGQPGAFDLTFVNGGGSSYTWTATNRSRYVWRFTLRFTGGSIRTDHVSCSRSEVVSSVGSFLVDTTSGHGVADCHDDCSAPEVTDRTPSTRTFAVGDDISLGRFTLHLLTVSGTGSSLSGTGAIRINFLNNIQIAVDFTGLQVNAANQVYEGTARAHWGGSSPLPDLSGAGSMLGLTQEQINGVSSAASQPARLVSQLVSGTPISLPIGIDTTVGGQQIVIGVVSLDFNARNSKMTAAVSIPLPFLGPGIAAGLGAKDICVSPNGLGGDGYGKLYLPADIGYRTDDPNQWGLYLKGCTSNPDHSVNDDGTYVSWTCHGFESLRIAADIQFPRSWLVPILSTGLVDGEATHKVTASFSTLIERRVLATGHASWGWMATATMGRFAPAGAPEFIMTVDNIAIDQTDAQNPDGITFPTDYTGEHGPTWRGFYMHRLSCALPPQINTFGSGRPVQIALQNFLIDNTGLSAQFRVENVVMYPQANFGEWGASIDTIGCDFVSSSLRQGYLIGRFQIPISDSALDYRAILANPPGSSVVFTFTIQPRDTINASIWVAKLHLDPTSSISLRVGGAGFLATANFDGSFTLAGNVNSPHGGGGMPGMSFRGLRFEGFRLTTERPYISPGTWHFASEQHSAGGFPLSIDNIGIVSGDRSGHPGIGLQFHVQLNLQSGSNAIAGGTTLSLWGVLAPDASGAQRFRFDGISCDAINLAVDVGSACHVEGVIEFYNGDATFGNGFRGAVHATILQKVTIEGSVQFGSVISGRDTNRYWYVDAMVYLPAGIPFMTGLAFYGFGGGAWYHMRRTGEPSAPPTTAVSGGHANVFVPDISQGLGLRAKVAIGTFTSDNAFNADITLEVQFLTAGGIGRITLLGDGYLLAGIHDRGSAPAAVHVGISYDFPSTTLHGRMSVQIMPPYSMFINVLGRDSMIVFHVDPGMWYFRMGMPPVDRRIGVEIGLGSAHVRFDTYLCMGDDIPSPVLPTEITSRLPDLHVVRNDAMSHGDGFAFGAAFSVHTGRQEFLIFYGQVDLLIGFDLAFLNLGPDAHCEGHTEPIGMRGWYAMGDIYAYFNAEIGLHVDLFFVSGDFRILQVAAAAALAGGAPDPTWLSGAVSGEFSILGGAVEGHCHFGFSVGDECRPVAAPRESPLASLGLISDMTPHNGETNVDCFVHPQAAFNFRVSSPFDVVEMAADGSDHVRTFRINISEFSVHQSSDRSNIRGTYSVASDGVAATFEPTNMLNGRTQYYATIRAGGQESVGGSWQPARRLDGSVIDASITNSFTTGPEPDRIPPENVAYSYPFNRQRFLLQAECRQGIVRLKQGMRQLFDTTSSGVRISRSHTSIFGRFIPADGGRDTAIVQITARDTTVSFTIPTLRNNTIYGFQIIRKTTNDLALFSSLRYTMVTTTYRPMAMGASVRVTQRTLPGTEVGEGEKLLYLYFFKTSQYNRLSEKVNSMTAAPTDVSPSWGRLELQTARFTGPELLDEYDMFGVEYQLRGTTYRFGPLVRPNGNSRGDLWHTRFTNPWIYDALSRLRTLHVWSGTTQFERYVANYGRGYSSVVLANYDGTAQGLVRDDEIMPSMFSGYTMRGMPPGVTLGIGSGPMVTITAPSIRVQYNQGIIVPQDFGTMQSAVAHTLAIYSSEFWSPADYRWLQSLGRKSYEPMYRASTMPVLSVGMRSPTPMYTIGFTYSYPVCQEPDTPASTYPKQFSF